MTDIDITALVEIEAQHQSSNDTALIWESSSRTHIGRVRHTNEDAYLESNDASLWVVADGMGGFSRGDYASKAIIDSLSTFKPKEAMSASIIDIQSKLVETNEKCLNAFRGKRVGSTVAALFSFGNFCYFLWAGDTRIYRLRNGRLEQMTTDHSVAQEKLQRGELSPEEARDHPSSHQLTRAVGAHTKLKLELHFDQALDGDRYLICSDGLYYAMADKDMQLLLSLPSEKALDKLFETALDYGGRDNITAIIIDAFKA